VQLFLRPLEKDEMCSGQTKLPRKERLITLDGTKDEHAYSEFDATKVYESAKESLEIMNSCLNLLFMILSHGCADDDEKGEIRRKLLFCALYELRSCSFYS
jgi:hypothetical protein